MLGKLMRLAAAKRLFDTFRARRRTRGHRAY